VTLVGPSVSLPSKGERRTALRASRLLILSLLKDLDHIHSHNSFDVFQHSFKTAGVTFADSVYLTNGRVKHAELKWRPTVMEDKLKTFTWEWEDGETGEIRTIKIPMPNLERDYDSSESREIILDRKPRLDNVEMPDWIEIIPSRKPN
jgi:hypothetical protein